MAENENGKIEPLPPITGDFAKWNHPQLVRYFLSLNDMEEQFYDTKELEALPLDQIKAWATRAFKVMEALKIQGKIPNDQTFITAVEGKVPMPTPEESQLILKTQAEQFLMQQLLAAHKKKQEGKSDQLQSEDIDIHVENGNGSAANGGGQQQRKQGVKRKFEDCYAPMPADEKYQSVSPQEAATFFNGGFSANKS